MTAAPTRALHSRAHSEKRAETMNPGLKKAFAIAGGLAFLARRLRDITQQDISQWLETPAERVIEIHRVTGVPCWELRPDLYTPTNSPSIHRESIQQHSRR
jgi:DNA-binding transcriptional regulator YdaS (Cro superfamily)